MIYFYFMRKKIYVRLYKEGQIKKAYLFQGSFLAHFYFEIVFHLTDGNSL